MVKLNGLSPSRANDFVQCPLKFRFRTIDKLPEPPSPAALRGTLVHAVLEHLFDVPAGQRTVDVAQQAVQPRWDELLSKDPSLLEVATASTDLPGFLAGARELVGSYFSIELPQALEPAEREKFLTVQLANGLWLRGFVDRIDIAPGGEVRLVDYKTGKQPKPQYGREAHFQMRFYALLDYKLNERIAHTLQLMYLGSRSVLKFHPTASDIERTEAEVHDIWADIARSAETGVWRTRKSPLCNWCSFKPLCPAWGNEAPQAPEITEIAGR